MALPKDFTTLGELSLLRVEDDDDQCILDRLVEVVKETFPSGWRDWRVRGCSKEELVGKKVDGQLLNKIRFAIPTISILKAFDPEAVLLSEKTYKQLKLSLLEWPFCRSLIVRPKAVAAKIHGSMARFEMVWASLDDSVKNAILSREETVKIMTENCAQKRKCSEKSPQRPKRVKTEPSTQKEIRTLQEQTTSLQGMMEKLLYQQQQIMSTRSNQSPVEDEYSDIEIPDSPSPESDLERFSPDVHDRSAWDQLSHTSKRSLSLSNKENLNSSKIAKTAVDFDFTPSVKEVEPKIPAANKEFLNQAIHCQRFGKESWNNLRYVEAQKKLQATPAFTYLAVNPQLSGKTPKWIPYDILVKFDQALGAITHGLLKERNLLQDALNNVVSESDSSTNDLKTSIVKHLSGSDTAFRENTDNLLQYVCGRRAEILELRRSYYKPPSKYMHVALHKVPPSVTHLFDDTMLSETFKQHGGYYKFFPSTRGATDRFIGSIAPSNNTERPFQQSNRGKKKSPSNFSVPRNLKKSANQTKTQRFNKSKKHYDAKPSASSGKTTRKPY